MTVHDARPSRVRPLVPGLVLAAAFLAACGGASAAPSAAPASIAAASTAAGPTSWAAWVDHQGFGASVGPNEVRRMARYIADHGGAEDLFNLDQDLALVTDIIAWLDAHPATACWANSTTRFARSS